MKILQEMDNLSQYVPAINASEDPFYDHVIESLSEKDLLFPATFCDYQRLVIYGIIQRAIHRVPIWFIVGSFTKFQQFCLASALQGTPVTFKMDPDPHHADAPLVVWQVDTLFSFSADFIWLPLPRLIIIDDTAGMDQPDLGPLIRQLLTTFPADIPMIMFTPPRLPTMDILQWLASFRQRPCDLMKMDAPAWAPLPLLLASDWELLPLVDRKRLSGKAKRIIKDNEPFKNTVSGEFWQRLLKLLGNRELTPALIIPSNDNIGEQILNVCPVATKNIGEILTQPVVMSILDAHPTIKDLPMLTQSLARRVAPYDCDFHPIWQQLVEHFLVLGGLDAVICTPESAPYLSRPFRSIVFCPKSHPQAESLKLERHQMDRITRLAGPAKAGQSAGIIGAHTPGLDMVAFKDLLIEGNRPVLREFRITSRTALNLVVSQRDPLETLNAMLIPGGENPEIEEHEKTLMAELPEAQCHVSLHAVAALHSLRLKWTLRLHKLDSTIPAHHKGSRQNLTAEKITLEELVRLLPCDGCTHFQLCQKKGSRKIRNILDFLAENPNAVFASNAGLQSLYAYYLGYFQAVDWVNAQRQLTAYGHLALRTGLEHPQPLIEALRRGLLPVGDPEVFCALLAGFIAEDDETCFDGVGKTPDGDIVASCSARLAPIFRETTIRMLKFGLLPPRFLSHQARIILNWQRGIDPEVLAGETGRPVGRVFRLREQARELMERIVAFGLGFSFPVSGCADIQHQEVA